MQEQMLEKLKNIEKRFDELTEQMSDPDIISDMNKFREVGKERSKLEPIIDKYREYLKTHSDLAGAKELLESDDPEMKEMAQMEAEELEPKVEELLEELKILLLPKDPNDSKDIYLEVRAGTGGDEAGLFAAELFRMYERYAERMNWKFIVVDYSETGVGGVKEAVAEISGEEVYGQLKFESGIHRVQRVPQTETQGRVHTSAASVVVLPQTEAEEVNIDPKDLKVDTYRASGAGGQHVNKTDSAIRITHLPTGIVVTCQQERSQHKNRAAALKILASRLQEAENEKVRSAETESRKLQVGSGDRSSKIRTYNFPQGRMTDHRISLTLYKLEQIMEGYIEDIIEALIIADRTERMQSGEV